MANACDGNFGSDFLARSLLARGFKVAMAGITPEASLVAEPM